MGFCLRGGRILALIPTALSDDAPSIASSLERLLDSDDETLTDDNVRLTPVFQEVYPNPSLEPDCIASASQASPAPSVSIPSTPTTSSTLPNRITRKTRSKRPTVPFAKILFFDAKQLWKIYHQSILRHLLFPWTIFTNVITDIVEQTNAYSVEKTRRSIELVEAELRDFLAIHIIMGVVSMPSHIQTIGVCNIDSKSRPSSVSIPYKRTKAGKRRQYVKDKPNKWCFKNYVRAGV
ncbi:unnamed protein product [Leptidea sinapis]|uniref:PiggyBac transposable element-derived protein domain-containing protein n=1 Tax=Leptidea sinapis TaxID=189913 RepID=A0A5E4QYB0_9NEOP|nr:unnamed protein product [Leptidea sinapis]